MGRKSKCYPLTNPKAARLPASQRRPARDTRWGWGADHAWLAAPSSPQRSVRRWCRRWAPWLTVNELNNLVKTTERSNKRWSHDQSAAVLEVSAADREKFKLWRIGANDGPNHEIRRGILRTKAAERVRKHRQRTGAKRGRPELKLSSEARLARSNAQIRPH
jgi:hypothetical protein